MVEDDKEMFEVKTEVEEEFDIEVFVHTINLKKKIIIEN